MYAKFQIETTKTFGDIGERSFVSTANLEGKEGTQKDFVATTCPCDQSLLHDPSCGATPLPPPKKKQKQNYTSQHRAVRGQYCPLQYCQGIVPMLPYNKNLDVQFKDVSIDLLQPRVGYCKF